jgi:hypothetical protein
MGISFLILEKRESGKMGYYEEKKEHNSFMYMETFVISKKNY